MPLLSWQASDFVGEGHEDDDLPPGWGQDDDQVLKETTVQGDDGTRSTRASTPDVTASCRNGIPQSSASDTDFTPSSLPSSRIQPEVIRNKEVRKQIPSLFTNAPAVGSRPPKPPSLSDAARQRLPWSVIPAVRIAGGAGSAPGSNNNSRATSRDGSETAGTPRPFEQLEDEGALEVRMALESLKIAKKRGANPEETLQKLEALQRQARSLVPQHETLTISLPYRTAAVETAATTAASIAAAKASKSRLVQHRCKAEAEAAIIQRKEVEAAWASLQASAPAPPPRLSEPAPPEGYVSRQQASAGALIKTSRSCSVTLAEDMLPVARRRKRANSAPVTANLRHTRLPPLT
jgi:hypothetical protein